MIRGGLSDQTKQKLTLSTRLRKLGQAHIARASPRSFDSLRAQPGQIPTVFASAVREFTTCLPPGARQPLPADSYKALRTLGSGINHPLDARSASAVWSHLASQPCFQQLDERSKNWFYVLKAAAERNGPALAPPAAALLSVKGREQGASHRFLVEALMLSHMQAGNPAAAQTVGRKLRVSFHRRLSLPSQRLLLAKLAEMQQNANQAR